MDEEHIEQRVFEHLRRLDADFTEIRIDPEHADTATFSERYGYPLEVSGNCILVKSKTGELRYAACVVQATRELDVNRVVRKLLGVRKASFAPPEEAEEVTGMRTDGVTPFGLPEELPVYVDPELVNLERIIVGGGSRRLKLELDPEVFRRMPHAQVVPNLARAPARG